MRQNKAPLKFRKNCDLQDIRDLLVLHVVLGHSWTLPLYAHMVTKAPTSLWTYRLQDLILTSLFESHLLIIFWEGPFIFILNVCLLNVSKSPVQFWKCILSFWLFRVCLSEAITIGSTMPNAHLFPLMLDLLTNSQYWFWFWLLSSNDDNVGYKKICKKKKQ